MELSNIIRWRRMGIVYMIGLFVLGVTALIVDLVIQKFFKRKHDQTIASVIALIIYVTPFFLANNKNQFTCKSLKSSSINVTKPSVLFINLTRTSSISISQLLFLNLLYA